MGKGTQMNTVTWLRADSSPGDYYELLGVPRFDPASVEILVAVRTANRQLWPYQNHTDPAVRSRALNLLRDLGRAEDVFSDAGKLSNYQRELAQSLFEEYREGPGRETGGMGFRGWLTEVKGVHPDGLPAVISQLMKLPAMLASAISDIAETEEVVTFASAETERPPWPRPEIGDVPEDLEDLHPIADGDEPADRADRDLVEFEPDFYLHRPLLVLSSIVALTGTAILLAWLGLFTGRTDSLSVPKTSVNLVMRGQRANIFVNGSATPLGPDDQAQLSLTPGRHVIRANWSDGSFSEESLTLDAGTRKTLEFLSRVRKLPDLDDKTVEVKGRGETWKRYDDAREFQVAGDWESAIQEYSRSLTGEPAFWPSFAGRGECHLRRGAVLGCPHGP